jgi:hypothetical protein
MPYELPKPATMPIEFIRKQDRHVRDLQPGETGLATTATVEVDQHLGTWLDPDAVLRDDLDPLTGIKIKATDDGLILFLPSDDQSRIYQFQPRKLSPYSRLFPVMEIQFEPFNSVFRKQRS